MNVARVGVYICDGTVICYEMEEQIIHPETVEVFISYFFKWGVPPKEKVVEITWDKFNELTYGRAHVYRISTWEDIEEFRKKRFKDTVFPDNADAAIARQLLGMDDYILPKYINIFRLK